jgi:hypothetical protein
MAQNKGSAAHYRNFLRRVDAGIFDYELVRRVADRDRATRKWVRRTGRPYNSWPPYHKADPLTRDLLIPEKAPNRPVSYRVLELLDRADIRHEHGFNESERSNMLKARARALDLVPDFLEKLRRHAADEETMGIAEDDNF